MIFDIKKKIYGRSEDWEGTSSQRRLYGESGNWIRPWNLDIICKLVVEKRILTVGIWSLMIYTDTQFGGRVIDSCKEDLKYRLQNLKTRLRVHPVIKRERFIHKPLSRLSPSLICAIENSIKIGTMSVLFISVLLTSGWVLAHIKHSGNVHWINK